MKRILIVNKSFALGGIQTSMVNMANELSNYYDVNLFVYNPLGPMKKRLNSNVTVLEPSWRFRALGMSLRESIRSRSVRIFLFRLFSTIWSKIINNKLPISIAIKHQKKMNGYDLAIAYHQEQRKKSVTSGFSRVVDRCVDATRKIAWLHYDSSVVGLDSSYNNQFYKKMDKIICVSKSLMDNFSQKNHTLKDKMDYCYNFMLYDVIREKGAQEQEVPYHENCIICFSASRLAPVKAIVRAIHALDDVFKKHPDVVWYIAGDGPEKKHIESAINEHRLGNQIFLLGSQDNPYSYIRNAHLTLNLSYHEAAPMIFAESKVLGTPVFATRTSSAEELLENNVDSFICENSEKGIRDTFAYLMENRALISKSREVLKQCCMSNKESLLKIQDLMK